MRLTTMLIGILVVAMVVTGLGTLMADISTEYGVTYSGEFADNISAKINHTYRLSKSVQDEMTDIKENPNLLDKIGGFFSSAYESLKTIGASIDLMDELIFIASRELGLPNWFWNAIKTIIVLMLIGILMYAVFKVQV